MASQVESVVKAHFDYSATVVFCCVIVFYADFMNLIFINIYEKTIIGILCAISFATFAYTWFIKRVVKARADRLRAEECPGVVVINKVSMPFNNAINTLFFCNLMVGAGLRLTHMDSIVVFNIIMMAAIISFAIAMASSAVLNSMKILALHSRLVLESE